MSIFAILCIILFLGELGSIFAIGLNKLIPMAFSNIGYSFIPVVCILFACYFTGKTKYLETKYVIAISIVPALSVMAGCISCFSPILGIFTLKNGILVSSWNILYCAFCVYFTGLSLTSLLMLLDLLAEKSLYSKTHIILLIFTIIFPLISGILSIMGVISAINVNPIGYFMSLLFIEWVVYGFNIFNTTHIHEEFINYVNAGMMFFDSHDKLVEFNNLCSYALGFDNDDLGKSVDELFKYSPRFLDFYHNTENLVDEFRLSNLHYNYYYSGIYEDISYFDKYTVNSKDIWINSFKREFYNGGKFLGTLFTFYDVTYYKNLTNEKEILLKEIHHRVKNNLQIILSLLNLDSRFHKDDPNIIIENIQTRISSIALIHNKVYNSNNLSSVDIGEYLDDLLAYFSSLKPENVKFNSKYEKKQCTLEVCIPLGLILIELINNSLKYAFPEDEGNIFVELFIKDDLVHLLVYDDGIGISEDIDIFNSSSLGLIVVNNLIKQIDGTLKIYECDGAGFEIIFNS